MSIEVMRQALEALEWAEYLVDTSENSSQEARWAFDTALPALRHAIEQAEFDAQSELDDQNRTPPTAPAPAPFKPDWVNYRQGFEDGKAAAQQP